LRKAKGCVAIEGAVVLDAFEQVAAEIPVPDAVVGKSVPGP
jgi:hypothetical protein